MSRDLPARPNLEFLKNEAKIVSAICGALDPPAQLADAQHALARDYGFASWPALKTHVESPGDGGNERIRRRLDRQRRAIEAASVEPVPQRAHPFHGPWNAAWRSSTSSSMNPARRCAAATPSRPMARSAQAATDTRSERDYELARIGNRRDEGAVEVIGRATYAVSADGRTLTIADGSGDSVIVLDRLIQ